MSSKVDSAIIMAAGLSSRFRPLSSKIPKALVSVKGEVLIERQICQLLEAGITNIIVVVGYKKDAFYYLKKKFNVKIVENAEYMYRNNHSSIYAAREFIGNSYICSADNYYIDNYFLQQQLCSYYTVIFTKNWTKEWCVKVDQNENIYDISIGGENSWYMIGHAFWNKKFSQQFLYYLEKEYLLPETYNMLWEGIYLKHIKELKMKIMKCKPNSIYEFDTLEELKNFDKD